MLRRPANLTVLGLAAMAVVAAGGAPGAAQRPAYPIVQEILVKENCAISLPPTALSAANQKPKFELDPTICHLETVLVSAHTEKSVRDNEIRRSRVTIREQEYVLQNSFDDPVVFVVEQNVPKGWQVDSDPSPLTLIPASVGDPKFDKVAVFRIHAGPGQAVRLHVGERHVTPLKTKVLKAAQNPSSGGL